MNGQNEADFTLRLRQGDMSAFDHVFHSFQPALVFFVNRMFRTRDLMGAEELVQDVFLKFYDRRKTFHSFSHIKSFLYLAAKNACLDKIAKDKVQMKRFDQFVSGFEEAEESILSQITYAEVLREVYDGIETLPERCRLVMKGFLEQGKNAQEIADELGVTVSTVNNQKARAIALLKERLSLRGTLFLLAIDLLFS